MTPSKEKRQHERKSCLLSVDWSVSDSVYTNAVKNVSKGGMFIETTEPFEKGQEISLRILAPENLKKINQLNAKIVRIEDEGIAVKFLNDDDHQKALVQFLIDNI